MKCLKCPYESTKLFNCNRHVQKCEGSKAVPEVASGSGCFTCNVCLQSVSIKNALKFHQQTQSCGKKASDLAQAHSPALKKYSKLPISLPTHLQKRSCYLWLQVSFILLGKNIFLKLIFKENFIKCNVHVLTCPGCNLSRFLFYFRDCNKEICCGIWSECQITGSRT